jgi:hypothetical protein
LSLQLFNPDDEIRASIRRIHVPIGTGIEARFGLVRTTGTDPGAIVMEIAHAFCHQRWSARAERHTWQIHVPDIHAARRS